jgi:hypothetical protein
MIKKAFVLLLFVALVQWTTLFAQQHVPLDQELTIQLKADGLISTLISIQNKTKISFSFDPDQLRNYQTAAVSFVNTPLNGVLQKILSGTPLSFHVVGNDIVITLVKPASIAIHGYVKGAADGEDLVGATVFIPALQIGVVTNQYGFYSLSLPEGKYLLRISNIGYDPYQQSILVDKNTEIQFTSLTLAKNILPELEVTQQLSPNPLLLNEKNYSAKQLEKMTYYAGETDVVKALQMQNGIKAISEGSSGLFIRGGNSDQNLILLDEAVVYNPSHLFGLVSVFNPDAINNLQVYKDYMPANYGGRLSSVIVNRMAEGNNKEFHVNGGISLMSARLAAEGPIVKNRGSYIIAFRRSLLDVFHNKFKLFNPSSVYYDVNAKANYQLSKRNTIYYSIYGGKDNLLSDNSFRNNWGNLTSTLRWNHIFNAKLFLNLSAIYSNYSNLLDLNADTLSQKSQWSTGVKDLTLKADYTYYRNPSNQIKFGLASTYHRFMPGETKDAETDEFNIARDRSLESAIYYQQELAFDSHFELNYGLRLAMFKNAEERLDIFDQQGNRVKQDEYKTYVNPEPRINISYLLSTKQRLFITYNRNYQYQQLVQNSTLAFSSLEPWIPASAKIAPQHSDLFSAGYRYAPLGYSFSLNSYYKKMANQMELDGHAQIIQNPAIRDQLRQGQSNAYGLETELNKTAGQFTGTLGYTYARVFKTIAGINNGNRFVANYDVPHEVKLTASYHFNKNLSLQTFFTYATGRPITLPTGYYQHDGINVPIFEGRNTSRLPDFSRIDISGQYRFDTRLSKSLSWSHIISAGVYNLYNRKNPLYYHLSTTSADSQKSSLEYAFGIYPWLAYSFKI